MFPCMNEEVAQLHSLCMHRGNRVVVFAMDALWELCCRVGK